MNKESILEILKKHKPYLQKRFKIKQIALFGSFSKDLAHKNSDIDILVDMESDFENFFNLKYFLEEIFQQKVDLVKEKNLRPFIKKKIANELIYV